MTQREAYLNGEWRLDTGLTVSVADLGFTMGVTVTERLRTFSGRVWRQTEHHRRLRRSCEIVGLDAAIADELDAAVGEFARRHEPLRVSASEASLAEDDWAIVAFATPGPPGGEPTRCVHGFPVAFATWADQYEAGVRLRVSDHRQTPSDCWPAELKCRSRMHYYLADQQARSIEPGARALLLDADGYVGETTTANLVAYCAADGVVSPRMAKVLPGVSVAVLRELVEAVGLPFVERDLAAEEVLTADEVWLASTSVCLLPVVACDGQPIGDGSPGPVYRRMLEAWNKAVGLDIAEQARERAAIQDP